MLVLLTGAQFRTVLFVLLLLLVFVPWFSKYGNDSVLMRPPVISACELWLVIVKAWACDSWELIAALLPTLTAKRDEDHRT